MFRKFKFETLENKIYVCVMCVNIYVCVCMCIYIYMYIYTYMCFCINRFLIPADQPKTKFLGLLDDIVVL